MPKVRNAIFACGLACVIQFHLVPTAVASWLTFEFTASIEGTTQFPKNPEPPEFLGFVAGQIIQGSFTFDPSTADTSADPKRGYFVDAVSSFKFGTFTGVKNSHSHININVDTPNGPSAIDYYTVYLNQSANLVSDVYALSLAFDNALGKVAAANVPVEPYSLDGLVEVPRATFMRTLLNPDGSMLANEQVSAEITSLTLRHIPEPANILLFSGGLIALSIACRQKKLGLGSLARVARGS